MHSILISNLLVLHFNTLEPCVVKWVCTWVCTWWAWAVCTRCGMFARLATGTLGTVSGAVNNAGILWTIAKAGQIIHTNVGKYVNVDRSEEVSRGLTEVVDFCAARCSSVAEDAMPILPVPWEDFATPTLPDTPIEIVISVIMASVVLGTKGSGWRMVRKKMVMIAPPKFSLICPSKSKLDELCA